MAVRPGSLDDYHSTREPSDFEYESDDPPELDPGHTDSEYEEKEDGAFSGYSSAGSVAVGYETDRTERSNTANQDKKRLKQKQRENGQSGLLTPGKSKTRSPARWFFPYSGNPEKKVLSSTTTGGRMWMSTSVKVTRMNR